MLAAQQQAAISGIQSTAGAVPVRNEKGELSMQKVKVQRYISGKRPEYAQYDSSDEESEEEDFSDRKAQTQKSYSRAEEISLEIARQEHSAQIQDQQQIDDPRLRRLQQVQRKDYDDDEERLQRHRHIHEPEIVESEEESEAEETTETVQTMRSRRIALGSDSETDTELSDTEIEQRRQRLRQKMMQQRKEEEVLMKEEEKSESSESESSEYEEESESEEENEPRMKPLFVRKRDRATIAEKEKEAAKQRQLEYEAKKQAKERRRQTLKLVEDSVKKDLEKAKPESSEPNIDDVCTDDENDEVEYEAWKLRELKRIKRDREEKEQAEREKVEVDRMRNLTEEERRQELRQNPKTVTNKAAKGKYKFLQKYFHRGAFYLDEEDDVLKRDFAQATLEDHFDKTILPKVMQVKNFGRCGRTKYTHLVDQDTTQFDSPWYCDTANNIKFHSEKAGGMRQVFEKPTLVKRKKMS
ncbi:Microfibrillar-associated protein 1 [Pseudolycoriella hygida]|uniref:Microfibrillar-associated protein 1 n=1 Tax=Pseudolycoriella hygida TaxID=35572 RepID=A0A9Q0MNB2_9DIPT|nr:Microfibrillar-associated protein 1 [Pseudolycoriella hygida]